MALEIICLVLVLSCGVLSAPQVYQATGVQHREVQYSDDIARVTSAILPEITSAFQELSSSRAHSNPSEPAYLQNTLAAFIPLSRKVLQATGEAEGRGVTQEQLDRLNVAELMMPSIFKFMEDMRGMSFDSRDSRSPVAESTLSRSNEPTGVLTPESGNLRGVAEATLELLPELSAVFSQISSDPGRSNPNDPKYVQRVISAFLPFSRKVPLATAKAEGRVVPKEELNRLDAAEAAMPAVFQFMNRLRENDFFETQANTVSQTNDTPAGVGSPALSMTIQGLDSTSSPSVAKTPITPASTSPIAAAAYQSAPNYPEVSHVSIPHFYHPYIPSVSPLIPGVPSYTYSTILGRL
ncbi:hypothetical protein SK128_013404 [Halocaridina rubra]|uniref:Uncharacterized protein n=1 Tax=Halocaridina rubra TaxID=373956 RepID=A0AAN8X2S5_HALRR